MLMCTGPCDAAAQARVRELLEKHGETWGAREAPWSSYNVWERGFIAQGTVTDAAAAVSRLVEITRMRPRAAIKVMYGRDLVFSPDRRRVATSDFVFGERALINVADEHVIVAGRRKKFCDRRADLPRAQQ